MQWRTTASTFYHSIPLPHATLILQASHLFQIRPRRSRIQPPLSDRSSSLPPQSQPDIHSLYKDRQLNDIIARLTRILTHPEFQPRLMRSSYSFRHHIIDVPHHQVRQRPQRTGARITADNQPSIHQYYAEAVFKRTKRRRRDLLDYPIFTTGDPPDLVRLAIEFGYTPFVDHLLHRGFRPRDLPEYFSMIPFLPVETITTVPDHEATIKSLEELNCIWGCMRVSNQELMESCSRADLDAVFKVLDATLISPRPSLDVLKSAQSDREHSAASKVDKGKQRHSCYDEGWIHHDHRHDSMSVEPAAHRLGEDDMMFAAGVGAGPSVSQQASSLHSRSRTVIAEDIASAPIEQNVPVIMPMPPEASGLSTAYGPTYRSAIFQSRQRVDSDSSLEQYSPLSDQGRSESKLHMPWVDGRALTSALLAICFRRDGYGSEEAEALEESRAVPIVSEILKYDCMLTAQALGQAVLGAAYSRSPGSLKRAQERRQQFLRKQRYDQRGPSSSSNSQPNPASQKSLDSREYLGDGKGSICVMDLLMERIGPRHLLSNFQQDHRRQQARELICREAGICGIGTRLSYFNGQGIGQASYNVSSTLHNASRTLFTGSGTRFTNSYMLPRGGFRGFGGNSSSHSSSVENAGNYEAGSGEPLIAIQKKRAFGVPPPSKLTLYLVQRAIGSQLSIQTMLFLIQIWRSVALEAVLIKLASWPRYCGIAIQVQAPEHIVKALLKMGFRFFSICDLDIRRSPPLALQFREQERMNRQLIEFYQASKRVGLAPLQFYYPQIHHLGSGSNTIIGTYMFGKTSSSAQPPSDRSQFVLAPIQLGESIEQITSAINYLGLDVGQPIRQAAATCFQQKELLLKVLLDHRLLIAQDALSGAVQVAASVGWKRGLEILLMENGEWRRILILVTTTTTGNDIQRGIRRARAATIDGTWENSPAPPWSPSTPKRQQPVTPK
ncbi:hypothetical protein BCR41DRAFT_398192 [Lobosporangium transversale]|uniref:Uncharacterized protein n=1 Tax=Lobosporangium transversale TaxID=64571 RepID=A0A1Y2GJT3_9FUNG|nr:hypothetical protein BCR41DRAFT_398192 [Lobosporangium transversale]ORZ11023.1 hypothetical protein BCR41DRAFT_398192 [Lobosporangium transversale]|eukprot:XP_021879540.1 hypothetical protein BCR41DRAFT_398192 [Lobosporangium transversale]